MTRLSVVLACFNGLPFLKEQLASICDQTRPPDELIICDDASTDGTRDFVDRYSRNAAFQVQLTRNFAQLGPARNFSNGALRASGDIIIFSDQDDWWEPDKLETIEAYFDRNPETEVVVHNIRVCDTHLNVAIEDYFGYLMQNRYSLAQFTKGCATAARRSICERAFPIPAFGAWMHDTRLLAVGTALSTVAYLPERLIRYRIHGSNHSGFVFPRRGVAGRLLAKLDTLAIGASSPLAQAMAMYKARPIGPDVAAEFAVSVAQAALEETGLDRSTANQWRAECDRIAADFNSRARVASRTSVLARLVGHTTDLATGTYARSGHIYGYFADVGRALNH